MLQHILLVAFRNNWRNRSSFFINLVSLTVGITGALFIFLWVNDELKMDKFHANDAQLFQTMMHWDYGERISVSEYTHGPLAAALREEIPEVVSATNVAPFFNRFNFNIQEESFATQGFYVDKAFFEVFDFQLLVGKKDEVLQSPSSIVISEQTALKWFGSVEQSVGSFAQLEGEEEFIISGVFENVPLHSTLQFDCLLSYDKLIQNPRMANRGSWETVSFFTMLTLKDGAAPEAVNKKISQLIQSRLEEGRKEGNNDIEVTAFLRPFSDRYLYGEYENGKLAGGRIEYVRLFFVIGVFLLLLACVNFMNLATAQASGRTKEVGIKKTFGIRKKNLILQYILESTLLAFLALLLSAGIVQVLLPTFNGITAKEIAFPLSGNWLGFTLGLTILVGLLAGSYPAFYLSSFQPAKVLKGISTVNKGSVGLRKVLVVFQFAVAIILMIGVFTVYQQIQFVQTKSLGYDKNNLIEFFMVIENRDQINTFVEEAKKIPGIENISSGNTPINHQNRTSAVTWPGKNPEEDLSFYLYNGYYDLIETMGMQVREGRTFARTYQGERQKAILNATAAQTIGLEQPLGKTITLWDEVELEVIGVVEDFHFRSLHEPIQPLIFRFMPDASPVLIAKLADGKEQEALASLQSLYQRFNPDVPFSFEFLDQQYNQLYIAEQKVAMLSQLFTVLALLISCLGLFGLALFIVKQKRREIGIRKVLGASVANITAFLSKDFMQLVLVAILIATPIAWYFSDQWLQNFAYHVELKWWVFALVGILTVVIAFLTVSVQSVKAALANPVEALKNE